MSDSLEQQPVKCANPVAESRTADTVSPSYAQRTTSEAFRTLGSRWWIIPMKKWLLLVCVLIGLVAFTEHPRAQDPPAAIYGIGDLSGGAVSSAVRDATRAAGVIYAVGASTAVHVPVATPPATPIPNLDTLGPVVIDGRIAGSSEPGDRLRLDASRRPLRVRDHAIRRIHRQPGSRHGHAWNVLGSCDARDGAQRGGESESQHRNRGARICSAGHLRQREHDLWRGDANRRDSYRVPVRNRRRAVPSTGAARYNMERARPRGTSADGLVMIGIASPGSIGTSVRPVRSSATRWSATTRRHSAMTTTPVRRPL